MCAVAVLAVLVTEDFNIKDNNHQKLQNMDTQWIYLSPMDQFHKGSIDTMTVLKVFVNAVHQQLRVFISAWKQIE